MDLLVICLVGLSLFPLIAANSTGLSNPLAVFRLLSGLGWVLFIPGYLIQLALFPHKKDLNGITRLGLSFGLSIATIPPLALMLNNLPWGLRLWPFVISSYTMVSLLLLLAWLRRRRVSIEERYIPQLFNPDPHESRGQVNQFSKVFMHISTAMLLLALTSGLAIAFSPAPGSKFTEFYLLGEQGLAENYPRSVMVGAPVTLALGVHNLEGVPATYHVAIQDSTGVIGQAGPIQLMQDETSERQVTFTLRQVGQDVEVVFNLYRDGQLSPYRSLRLFMNVSQAP